MIEVTIMSRKLKLKIRLINMASVANLITITFKAKPKINNHNLFKYEVRNCCVEIVKFYLNQVGSEVAVVQYFDNSGYQVRARRSSRWPQRKHRSCVYCIVKPCLLNSRQFAFFELRLRLETRARGVPSSPAWRQSASRIVL